MIILMMMTLVTTVMVKMRMGMVKRVEARKSMVKVEDLVGATRSLILLGRHKIQP